VRLDLAVNELDGRYAADIAESRVTLTRSDRAGSGNRDQRARGGGAGGGGNGGDHGQYGHGRTQCEDLGSRVMHAKPSSWIRDIV
jgi:hypothetical protein